MSMKCSLQAVKLYSTEDLRFLNQTQFQMLYGVVENTDFIGSIFNNILSSTFH